MGSSTTDTGNTSDGTTGTPGLSRGLVASLLAHRVSLTLVLSDALYSPGSEFIVERAVCYSLCTCCTTSSLIGAVRTEGKGRDEEASAWQSEPSEIGGRMKDTHRPRWSER